VRGGLHPAAVAATSVEARRGRSPADRLGVRSPAATARALDRLLRLPRSRARTRALEFLIRRTLAAYNRRDWELNTIAMDPERYTLRFADPDRDRPVGTADAYHGVEGYLEFNRLWLEMADVRFRLERIVEPRPEVVVMLHTTFIRGGESGLAVDFVSAAMVEFRAGRLVDHVFSTDPDATLRSLGLPSDALSTA
jgi:hypothetical protein